MSEFLKEMFERELESKVAELVEDEFEARRRWPVQVCEVPYIGGFYAPHAPRERHADLKQLATRALTVQRWLRWQPDTSWACDLPLTLAEIEYVQDSPDRQISLWGRFAGQLRKVEWDFPYPPSFVAFCLQQEAREAIRIVR